MKENLSWKLTSRKSLIDKDKETIIRINDLLNENIILTD